jgi:hypothetical protein
MVEMGALGAVDAAINVQDFHQGFTPGADLLCMAQLGVAPRPRTALWPREIFRRIVFIEDMSADTGCPLDELRRLVPMRWAPAGLRGAGKRLCSLDLICDCHNECLSQLRLLVPPVRLWLWFLTRMAMWHLP